MMGIDKSVDEKAERLFFDRANQYYLTGRFAILFQQVPVGANLLHHAVEMYLKGVLVRQMKLDDLRVLGHCLDGIWSKFKGDFPATPLDAFDSAILTLSRFENLRYPDVVLKKGMAVQTVLNRDELIPVKGNARKVSRYQLCLEDVDELNIAS